MNFEIILKAVERAILNGWKLPEFQSQKPEDFINEVLFSDEFARHFWGNELTRDEFMQRTMIDVMLNHNKVPRWKFHKEKMALSVDPLEYIGEFIDEPVEEEPDNRRAQFVVMATDNN